MRKLSEWVLNYNIGFLYDVSKTKQNKNLNSRTIMKSETLYSIELLDWDFGWVQRSNFSIHFFKKKKSRFTFHFIRSFTYSNSSNFHWWKKIALLLLALVFFLSLSFFSFPPFNLYLSLFFKWNIFFKKTNTHTYFSLFFK